MDEDEDTYGFGSFSDLFDVGPTPAVKPLDLDALSVFCMPERLLSRFQHKCCVLFQHVGAKFDGVRIDGGLGALGVSAMEGGGIVWMQTTQSDSDALDRRKKELQDITNRCSDERKSAAALFVPVNQVAKMQPVAVQNKVLGVEITLAQGNKLELIFMPGPFADAAHRDEFVEMLKEQMSGDKETHSLNTTDRQTAAKAVANTPTGEQKEEFRLLVRRYSTLDQMSGEALEIAKQVYAGTGYQLGPMSKKMPKFSVDAKYRKKMVKNLTGYLKRMNQEWSEAEEQRQLHTKAKYTRNKDGMFEYTDTITGELIPLKTYEQRYLDYVKAPEVNPVLHMFPVAKEDKGALDGAEADKDARKLFMESLGIDITSSCIIDKNFFSAKAIHSTLDTPVYKSDDTTFRAAVDSARMKIWKSWGSSLSRVSGNCVNQVKHDQRKSPTPTNTVKVSRKRSRDRRRSIVLPNSHELQSTVEATIPKSSQEYCTVSSADDGVQSRTKRSRSTPRNTNTAQKSRRKARRQSIVNTVDLPPTMAGEAASEKIKTPRSSRKSPKPRHSANGYFRETSSLEMVGDEDSNACRLCYSEQALVHMKPCDHAVCGSCWSRLSPPSGKNETSSRRVCPWDREVVMKR